MTKYTKYMRKARVKKQVPPLWKGIGCIMMMIVPLMSYGLAYVFLQAAKSRNLVPAGMLGHWQFPEWAWNTPILATPVRFLANMNDALAMLLFFIVTLVVVAGLISIIYTAVYQVVGPDRYSDVDAPPAKRKVKEYKR